MKSQTANQSPAIVAGDELEGADALAYIISGRAFFRVASKRTGLGFSYKVRQISQRDAEGLEVAGTEEPAWWLRVRVEGDDFTYLGLAKGLIADEAEAELRRKVDYLEGRGLTEIAQRVLDDRDLAEAGVFPVARANRVGALAPFPYVQVRLTKKSFQNGFNYKSAEFKAIRHVLTGLAEHGRAAGVTITAEEEPAYEEASGASGGDDDIPF